MERMILFLDEGEDSEEAHRLFPEARIQRDDGACPTLISADGEFKGIENIKMYWANVMRMN